MGIPRRIIQTWKRLPLPPLFRAASVNLKLLNPEFEYLFFDDAHVDTFVREKFPEFTDVFHAFGSRIQQMDFFRYLAVYHYGGFYFDLDVLLFEKLESLLRFACVFPFERIGISWYFKRRYKMHWDVGNYAFAAQSGHPFLEKIIENCCRAQKDPDSVRPILRSMPAIFRKNSSILCTTGPMLVTKTYAENPQLHSSIEILRPEDICDRRNWNKFGAYGLHLRNGSWRPRGSYVRKLYWMIWKYCLSKTEEKAIAAARRFEENPTNTFF